MCQCQVYFNDFINLCSVYFAKLLLIRKIYYVSFSESEKAKVFAEADERVQFIDESKFKEIAREVCGLNGDLYARSYDWGVYYFIVWFLRPLLSANTIVFAGVEEYIEALTFLTYLREGRLLTLQEIQNKLCFRVTPISSESGVSPFLLSHYHYYHLKWNATP